MKKGKRKINKRNEKNWILLLLSIRILHVFLVHIEIFMKYLY